ncbi:hypothetical protein FRC17_001385 [Serendipita sp. 399]|nr:hypothetical protein FRC17_001385 [Serendipita sp. 399]
MRKVWDLSEGFKLKQNERFEKEVKRIPRIGVLGLYGLGKSTLINALIGEDILTTYEDDWNVESDLSAGWPIVIRHEPTTKTPRLTIEISNLIPILDILHEETFDPSESPLQEPVIVAIWEEYQRLREQGLTAGVMCFEGVTTIRNALHSIGKCVRAFAPLSREGREFELNSVWPVIEVCMDAFHDTKQSIEFLDLPGMGNRKLVMRDVEAQWKTSFNSCQAFIYTVKADLALLDSSRLELNLKYLEVSMTYRGSPWLVVATHSDQLELNPKERLRTIERLQSGYRRFIGGRGVIPFRVPVLLCSPMRHLYTKNIQRLMEDSLDVPSMEQIESVGGLPNPQILESFGEAFDLSRVTHASLTKGLNRKVQGAAMEQVSSSIKTLLVPTCLKLISKTAMSTVREDVWSISNHLQDVLTWNSAGNEKLQDQRRLSGDYFQKAATFCASWSVKLLENQREWHRSVDAHLLNLRQSLQDGLTDVWAQTLRSHGLRKPDANFFVNNPLKATKGFEKKAEDAHSLCEIRVKELVSDVWAKCLDNLLQHLASHVFGDAEEERYRSLRQLVFDDIETIRKQSCEQVLNGVIRKLEKRVGLTPSTLAEDAFWRAHEGHMRRKDSSISTIEESLHLLTDLPKDYSNWSQTPSISSTFEQVSYLEQWKKHKEIAANGLEAVGFLVVPPHTPPPIKATSTSFARGMSSNTLRTQMEEMQEAWYDSMRQQSLMTLEGSLRAVSFIGIRAVLDVFIAQIHKLEGNSATQAVSDQLKVAELEEVITAEANAVCVWAALDGLTQIEDIRRVMT